MGIDIYARWDGQSADEIRVQAEAWQDAFRGSVGYLREAYHGEPYATRHLVAEAFSEPYEAPIPAATLRERLPRTLALVEERFRTIYESRPAEIAKAKQSFRDFVSLCERTERETGKPARIHAWF
jgi:hypothetical protein